MKLLRDLTGQELAKALEVLGYGIDRPLSNPETPTSEPLHSSIKGET